MNVLPTLGRLQAFFIIRVCYINSESCGFLGVQ